MSRYLYDDSDNEPMHDELMDETDRIMKYTVYSSRAEMEAYERGDNDLPFAEPPDNGCWNCIMYNGDYCTKLWNNLDEDYKDEVRDERSPDDDCEDWEHDETAIWEDYH